ncbi:hypothetical protein K438DRAFT_1767711 [Mycena galopus ATCC 62051]|nr:hypothetical protein K438DRAFT_1767711 [Mycena galopus ATCC 62051]
MALEHSSRHPGWLTNLLAPIVKRPPRHIPPEMVLRILSFAPRLASVAGVGGASRKLLVKDLSLVFEAYDFAYAMQYRIYHFLPSFRGLTTLTISNTCLTDHIHTVATRISHLRHLRLISCGIHALSRDHHPAGHSPFAIETLTLIDVQFFAPDPTYERIETRTADQMQRDHLTVFPVDLLRGLTSLDYTGCNGNPVHWMLPDTWLIQHLRVCCDPAIPTAYVVPLVLPSLLTFRGPLATAVGAATFSPQLFELDVSDPLPPEEALSLLAQVGDRPLINVELLLTQWDRRVIATIFLKFPLCKRLKLKYPGPGPHAAELRSIGSSITHTMPRLSTFLLCGHVPALHYSDRVPFVYNLLSLVTPHPLLQIVVVHQVLCTRASGDLIWEQLPAPYGF